MPIRGESLSNAAFGKRISFNIEITNKSEYPYDILQNISIEILSDFSNSFDDISDIIEEVSIYAGGARFQKINNFTSSNNNIIIPFWFNELEYGFPIKNIIYHNFNLDILFVSNDRNGNTINGSINANILLELKNLQIPIPDPYSYKINDQLMIIIDYGLVGFRIPKPESKLSKFLRKRKYILLIVSFIYYNSS